MKTERIRLVVLNFALIIGVLIASISAASAQVLTDSESKSIYKDNSNIKAVFTVYLNDQIVPSDSYEFRMINDASNIDISYKISQQFVVLLQYGEIYKFSLGKNGYNTKSLVILTAAPRDNWVLECNIYLYDNEPDQFCGMLSYDKHNNRFKHTLKE